MRVKFLATIASGFIWTFLFSTMLYYIYGKYPITAEIAADMREKLKSQNDTHTEQ